MHERSLMLTLLKQVERIRAEHDNAPVTEIAVEVGVLSGVEATLLTTAFSEFADSFPDAQLNIQELPVTALCQECQHIITMDRFLSVCPSCRSSKVQITGGDTFRLLHVTLNDSARGHHLHEGHR